MPARALARASAALLSVVACALVLGGCDYIVTPADDASPTPQTAGSWNAVATAISQTPGGDVHVDLAIRNDTGAWSSMQVAPTGAVTLTAADGTSATCGTAFVGTGGNSLAPGFQARGYTGGTKAKPVVQLLYVECHGATPAAGAHLAIAYTYVTGDFDYYSPAKPAGAKLDVDLGTVTADLSYPVASAVDGLVEKVAAPIVAINKCALTLKSVTRAADKVTFAWHTENPTAYPTYVHIGTPPVIGSDGVIYGFYQSPHLADTPITAANQTADWTTVATVPPDVTGLYVLVSVESRQQKLFVSHVIDITAN